jgi:superfamily II DNA or RNA helicase/HKD family nuclease
MTKIIDNSKTKMSTVLNEEIRNVSEVAIATAYFNVRGFSLMKDSLFNVPLKLLLGREPGSNIPYQDEILSELEKEAMENEDDLTFFYEVKNALEYFSNPEVKVRIVRDGFFHGKAYMGAIPSFSSIKNGFAVTGSSNFTYGGLYSNNELNMLTTDREVVEELSRWFEGIWGNSEDFKEDFLSFLKNYVTAHSPYEIVARALYETLKDQLDTAEKVTTLEGLYPHQKLSVSQAWDILNRYGGVIIADPVGLGKTRVGISLAYMAMRHSMKPMIIAPKSILGTTWKNEMDTTIGLQIPSINTEKVSADPDILTKEYKDKDFIIIDEAHYFRTSSSKRFEGLTDYLSKKGRKIVLITATPINNSLMDLYNLLTLFVNDDAVPDISPSLKGFFTEQQKKLLNAEKIDLDPILKKFVVRISRETAIKVSGDLPFPTRVIDTKNTSYPLSPDPTKLSNYIDRLSLAYYDLAIDKQVKNLTLPDGSQMEAEQQVLSKERLKELVRNVTTLNYFKRLESSICSLEKSLESLKGYVEMTVRIAETNKIFIPPKFKNKVYEDDDGFYFSGSSDKQFLNLSLTDEERDGYIKKAKEDLNVINEVVDFIKKSKDNKFEVFLNKLISLDIKGNNGVIIFTSFADTAEYLHSKLKEVTGIKERLLLTTGSYSIGNNMNDRYDIIDYFMKQGGYLISTDVLSAGQNLQNAQYLLNYDFPWNPVVLIQRTGRIDRMNSHFDKIYIMNITPDNKNKDDPASLEHFIGLMVKLTRKIEGIKQGIGSDASILGEEPMPKDFNILIEILKGNNKELDNLEDLGKRFGLMPWETDPLEIFEGIKEQLGEEKIRAIPTGSGAYKKHNKNGIFVLYRSGEKGKYDYHWVLRYEDGELITDEIKILNVLMQPPNENKGEFINYETLKSAFSKVRDSFYENIEKKDRKQIRSIPKNLKNILEYVNKNTSLIMYVPSLMEEQGNVNLIKILKNALDNGRLKEKLEEVFPEPGSLPETSDTSLVPKNIHRIVWCVICPS